jgi:hypothetical protein
VVADEGGVASGEPEAAVVEESVAADEPAVAEAVEPSEEVPAG